MYRIWSLGSIRGEKVSPVVTLEIDLAKRAIVQARGFGNSYPFGKQMRLVRLWAAREGLRLAIWPKAFSATRLVVPAQTMSEMPGISRLGLGERLRDLCVRTLTHRSRRRLRRMSDACHSGFILGRDYLSAKVSLKESTREPTDSGKDSPWSPPREHAAKENIRMLFSY